MKKRHKLILGILLLFCSTLVTAQEEKQKDSWYIGFGIGYGDATARDSNGKQATFSDKYNSSEYSSQTQFYVNIGVGAIINSNFHLGFEWNRLRRGAEYMYTNSWTGQEETSFVSLQVDNFLLTSNFFPYKTGLFFKIGLGAGMLEIKPNDVTKRGWGFAVSGGTGYALWVGESMNLIFNLDYSHSFYDGSTENVKDIGSWQAYVSLYWF